MYGHVCIPIYTYMCVYVYIYIYVMLIQIDDRIDRQAGVERAEGVGILGSAIGMVAFATEMFSSAKIAFVTPTLNPKP